MRSKKIMAIHYLVLSEDSSLNPVVKQEYHTESHQFVGVFLCLYVYPVNTTDPIELKVCIQNRVTPSLHQRQDDIISNGYCVTVTDRRVNEIDIGTDKYP